VSARDSLAGEQSWERATIASGRRNRRPSLLQPWLWSHAHAGAHYRFRRLRRPVLAGDRASTRVSSRSRGRHGRVRRVAACVPEAAGRGGCRALRWTSAFRAHNPTLVITPRQRSPANESRPHSHPAANSEITGVEMAGGKPGSHPRVRSAQLTGSVDSNAPEEAFQTSVARPPAILRSRLSNSVTGKLWRCRSCRRAGWCMRLWSRPPCCSRSCS